MQLGMVGLGRMGANMAERLRRGGHEVIGYDRDPDVSDVGSLSELADRLSTPHGAAGGPLVYSPRARSQAQALEQGGARCGSKTRWRS